MMRKLFVLILAVMMVGACALAEVSLDEAKQIAMEHAGVAAEKLCLPGLIWMRMMNARNMRSSSMWIRPNTKWT